MFDETFLGVGKTDSNNICSSVSTNSVNHSVTTVVLLFLQQHVRGRACGGQRRDGREEIRRRESDRKLMKPSVDKCSLCESDRSSLTDPWSLRQ